MVPFLQSELGKISPVVSFCMNSAKLNKRQLVGLVIGAIIIGAECIGKVPPMLSASDITLEEIRSEIKASIWTAYNAPICEWVQKNL
jgi:hypothetical protein